GCVAALEAGDQVDQTGRAQLVAHGSDRTRWRIPSGSGAWRSVSPMHRPGDRTVPDASLLVPRCRCRLPNFNPPECVSKFFRTLCVRDHDCSVSAMGKFVAPAVTAEGSKSHPRTFRAGNAPAT